MRYYPCIFLSIFIIFTVGAESIFLGNSNARDGQDQIPIKEKPIKLNKDNFVTIRGAIDESTSSKFINDILHINQDTIYIYLDTPGGSVLDGNDIVETIDTLSANGKDIICLADRAASMGFIIFQSCPERYVTKNSVLMQHQMSALVKGPIEHMKSRMRLLETISKRLNKRQSERLGLTQEEFDKKVLSDWWIYGEDCVDENVADKVVSVSCSREIINKRENQTIHSLFGDFSIEYNKCPLIKDYISIKKV